MRDPGDPVLAPACDDRVSEVRFRWLGFLSRRAQEVCGQMQGNMRSRVRCAILTGLKLPRSKAVAPSGGSPARTARSLVPELLADDDAARRRKRCAGELATIERSNQRGVSRVPRRASRAIL
jgi:hypothetical protein